MTLKLSSAAVIGLTVILIASLPALAGGWSVVTLDTLPEQVIAGEPVEIGFTVRAHGRTPVAYDGIQVQATHLESGEKLSFVARSTGRVGHYRAELRFPHHGVWDWGVSMGMFIQPMPSLDVLAAAPPALLGSSSSNATAGVFSPALAGIAGMCGAAALLALTLRKPSRWAVTLALAALAFGGAGFAAASGRFVAEADQPEVSLEPALAARGSDLFVAKGCVICHIHQGIPDEYVVFNASIGPELTGFSADPGYLLRWLSDPAAIKPKTAMPNLELSQPEIDALIAFLNAD